MENQVVNIQGEGPENPEAGVPVLMPKYVGQFSCIGSDCEDTCCWGQRIDLDATILRQYEANRDPELMPLFAKHVKRNSDSTPATGYLQEPEGSCQDCPFLDASRLCRIQARLGESALPERCDSFPRSTVRMGNFDQMALSLSCPEAARLALLAEDAFELEACESHVRPESVKLVNPRGGLTLEDMEELRTEMFQILLTRELDLSRRLAVLGLFCHRLAELMRQEKGANLPGLVQAMDSILENGALQIPLRPEKERQYTQAKFASGFLSTVGMSELTAHHRKVFDAVTSGLGLQADGTQDEVVLMKGIVEGSVRLEAALQAAPHLLEHYLVNEAFREVFPWSGEDPFRHYINLLLGFTILRAMLLGRAASQEAVLTPQELVETVQVFCRRVQNEKHIIDQLNPAVTFGDWTSPGTLFLVV